MGTSDALLVERAIQGDRAAFALLVRRYQAAATRAVRSLGVPDSEVDDAVQDSLVAAWRSLGAFDLDRAFQPWLMRIVINKARDLSRRRRVRGFFYAAFPVALAEQVAATSPDPEMTVLAKRELARVTAILSQLPTGPREALVLTALVGMTQEEAAEALGVGVKTIEGRVARARARLAKLIAIED